MCAELPLRTAAKANPPLIAAALVVCAAIALTAFPARHGPAPAFNDIEFGPELKHNGVFVTTDEPTEAKILWVLTEGV